MSTVETVTKSEQSESLVVYEIGYLLLPTISEEKLGDSITALRSIIEGKSGVFIADGAPTMRPLAYTISKIIQTKRQKFDHAYFGWVKFEVDSAQIAPIKKSIEALEDVLRALFIKTVRESTLMANKVMDREAEKAKAEWSEEASGETKAPADVEEIDKSIEALVN